MPRDIGTTPPATTKQTEQFPVYFLRTLWPAPTGTLYWTTHPDETFDYDVGFGSVTWDGGLNEGGGKFVPGQAEQGDQGILSISDVTFNNANNYFSNIAKLQTYGVRGIVIDLWKLYFQTDTAHAFYPQPIKPADDAQPIKVFGGRMDRAEYGELVKVSCIAGETSPLDSPYPKRRYTLAWGFLDIPPANLSKKFGIAGIVKLPTAKSPIENAGNPVGGGAPPPGDVGPNARQRPILSNPRPGVPTGTGGGPVRPGTRTVNR